MRLVGACVVSLAAALAAQAGVGVVVVNFDTYPGGAPVLPGDILTTQWSQLGVEFTNGAGGGTAPSGNSCSYSPPNHAYTPQIVAWFVDPCTGVPSATDFAGTRQDNCWVSGEGIDMNWYDAGGGLLNHAFNSGGGNFASYSTPQPLIARLDMTCILQGIDDFTFTPPIPVLKGDMDCSGMRGLPDVPGFVLALVAPDQYAAAYPACHFRRADMNCDRQVNGDDIEYFVAALIGP